MWFYYSKNHFHVCNFQEPGKQCFVGYDVASSTCADIILTEVGASCGWNKGCVFTKIIYTA